MSKSAIIIISIVFFAFAILYQATGMIMSFYVGEENMVELQQWFGKLSILSVSSFVSLILGTIGSIISSLVPPDYRSYHCIITPDMWTDDQADNKSGYEWYVRIPTKQHKLGKKATVVGTFYREGDKPFTLGIFPSASMLNGDIYVCGPAPTGDVKVVIIP